MEIEIQFLGEELEGPLKNLEFITPELRERMVKRGVAPGNPVYSRHLTVFSRNEIVFTAEDAFHETNAASEGLRLLGRLHALKTVTIVSINGVQIPVGRRDEWDPREKEALARMAREKDMSEFGILRQALRLYDLADHQLRQGHNLAWTDKDGKLIREPIGGCMGD